jgi:hypothetical protein
MLRRYSFGLVYSAKVVWNLGASHDDVNQALFRLTINDKHNSTCVPLCRGAGIR